MVVLFAGLVGCTPTYAPPLQTAHGGAPARVAEGDLAVRGSAVGFPEAPPSMGGPALAYGVRDSVAVEAGGNASGGWGLGWAGVRYTHAPRRHAKHYLAIDVHGAGGAGWGGELRGNTDPEDGGDGRRAIERVAGGGALGAGVAGHFSFFSVFGRVRGQLTGATNVPATVWADGGLGMQFRIAKTVDLYTQAMWVGYRNRVEHVRFSVPLYEVGIAVRIPTLRYGYRYR